MDMSKDYEERWPEVWEEFWKPLLTTEGKFDEEKIKNEMHDLVFVLEQVGKIYSRITGGHLSNPMYYAESIISEYNREVEDAYSAGYSDGKSDALLENEECDEEFKDFDS